MSYTSWQQLACNIHNYANFSQVMWTVSLRCGTPATFLTKSQKNPQLDFRLDGKKRHVVYF